MTYVHRPGSCVVLVLQGRNAGSGATQQGTGNALQEVPALRMLVRTYSAKPRFGGVFYWAFFSARYSSDSPAAAWAIDLPARLRRRLGVCNISKAAPPAIIPQNAEAIPSSVTPDAVTRKVTMAASRWRSSCKALTNPLPMVLINAKPAMAMTSSL